MEDLPFSIEEWDAAGEKRIETVARAVNPGIGWAAYNETVRLRPQAHILFRHGIRVIAEHQPGNKHSVMKCQP
jgi:hypothetical protein